MTEKQAEQGINEEIRERLAQVTSWEEVSRIRKDLIGEGKKEGTIDAVISHLRRQGRLPPRTAVAKTRALMHREALPAEYLIDMAELPDPLMCRGYKMGQLNLLVAARLLQELGRIQAGQVDPIINLVQALRLEEKSAAEAARGEGRAIAQEAAQEASQGVAGELMQALGPRLASLEQKKPDIATTQNPMQGVMARSLEAIMDRMMNSLTPGSQGQQNAQSSLPQGWTQETKKEPQ